MIKVMSVFGTRPEAIKMCPLIIELKKNENIQSVVCLTGQHREMLTQVMEVFKIEADYDLEIMRPGQTLTTITVDILERIEKVISKEKPDIVLVHGDTTTSFAASLAAFYQKIPVGHVEAGLRTYDKYSPYPEEINRNLIGRIANFHFAPTELNRSNLERENITENVFITGNTVIDSFQTTIRNDYEFKDRNLSDIPYDLKRIVLVTAHRRENWGEPLENICNAIKDAVEAFGDIEVVYPVHLNPIVRNTANEILGGIDRVHLIDPLDVEDMHNLMSRCYLVLTDSGGLQEEAPALGRPVLVLRTETERPEAVQAGTVRVVGVDREVIFNNTKELLENEASYNKMAKAVNPYGDGHASERIVKHIVKHFS